MRKILLLFLFIPACMGTREYEGCDVPFFGIVEKPGEWQAPAEKIAEVDNPERIGWDELPPEFQYSYTELQKYTAVLLADVRDLEDPESKLDVYHALYGSVWSIQSDLEEFRAISWTHKEWEDLLEGGIFRFEGAQKIFLRRTHRVDLEKGNFAFYWGHVFWQEK
ncbi:MAG: hypothetical protein G01um101418_512 [Parcubacteria group bacterium Gr01-1014_18]|nr:MAG: hypothetical protein Greene041636_558 [Parcubacteria group bacterium Greene0416_36]TSC80975.1 MAG: hypothetical protein G01um101418_512 [Parcubacteria group bacterium Gr01-1014_18]TSC98862.1 MAG: hypothetical protein Greene101420_495 [Parcubacteria group bacterium Greene1014_20]TSD06552.1 MAG: hypothetical protein Greene07142_827 [Parcubacteria group bacterium Greene0714_2]